MMPRFSQKARTRCMHGLLIVLCFLIVARLIDLMIVQRDFLVAQSRARILRKLPMSARRGIIYDRKHKALAVSAPVKAVWVDPTDFPLNNKNIARLTQPLGLSESAIKKRIVKHRSSEFVYIKRGVLAKEAKAIQALNLPGVYLRTEYRRFYPQGELFSHLVGVTNVDERGQEGIELSYDTWLRGISGKKTVIRDRLGRVVSNLRVNRKPKQGHDLQLSVDTSIQYAAADALKKAVKEHDAVSGSVVVIDAQNGDLLAMVNYPSYDPNQRRGVPMSHRRNRAVTDSFEPGSTIKPFTVVGALESGRYNSKSVIHTSPGWMRVGRFTIRDELNYGDVTLRRLLKKSSNIGAAKIMLSLDPQAYSEQLSQFGFGVRTQSGLQGEVSGRLIPHTHWASSEVATMAYGYGMSITTLQLAHAYSILASGGMNYPVRVLKQDKPPIGERVIPARIAHQVSDMLFAVVEKGGTGKRARVAGYRVAGKTGTANIATPSGYDKKRVISSFVGYAPASKPRFVVAVVIREPHKSHFGALVAAPAFAKIMAAALHSWAVLPDSVG